MVKKACSEEKAVELKLSNGWQRRKENDTN